jgi:hypothetical protein
LATVFRARNTTMTQVLQVKAPAPSSGMVMTDARASRTQPSSSRTIDWTAAIARNGPVRTPSWVGALPPNTASPRGVPAARASWNAAAPATRTAAATAALWTAVKVVVAPAASPDRWGVTMGAWAERQHPGKSIGAEPEDR